MDLLSVGVAAVNGPAHIVIGGVTALAANYFAHFLPGGYIPLGMAVCAGMLGGLLPDIDHPNSTISHDLHIARGDGPLGCSGCIGGLFRHLLGGHRGASHSLLAVGLCFAFAWFLLMPFWKPFGLAFTAGYASHLVADLGHGVPLFWPITHHRFGLGM
jgi:membrane-bound metal-dependent hydrolase YbcI (DUF457 family)